LEKKNSARNKEKRKNIQKERHKITNFDNMVSSGTNKGNTLTEYSAVTFTQVIATSQIHKSSESIT